MAHLPVNHPAQPVYRLLAGLVGIYILTFGIVGLIQTWGLSFFDRGDNWVLALQTNPAFSLLSTIAGAVILGGSFVGGNVDHFINLWGSTVFLVAGVVMMALLETYANLLNFSMTTVIASFIIGVLLLLSGLYGKVGPPELGEAEDHFRHGELGRAMFEQTSEEPADFEKRTDVPTPDE
jgi:hypothetical protein